MFKTVPTKSFIFHWFAARGKLSESAVPEQLQDPRHRTGQQSHVACDRCVCCTLWHRPSVTWKDQS